MHLYNSKKMSRPESPLWTNITRPLWPLGMNYFKIRAQRYDVSQLRNDLSIAIQAGTWVKKDKPGDWKSITLKGYQGQEQDFLTRTHLGTGTNNKYEYTSIMDNCSYFKQILDEIPTDVYLVRVLRLGPRSRIKFHTDEVVFRKREEIIRCHIPIITHPDVKFQIGYPLNAPAEGYQVWNAYELGSRYLEAGYLYYTNVNTLHGVVNDSDIERYHLCIDFRPPPHIVKVVQSSLEKN